MRISTDTNNIVHQLDLIDMYRTLHLTRAEYTLFFPSTHETFIMIDHILGQKTTPNTLNKTEILQVCPLASMGVKLEVNNKGNWEISKHL